VVYLIAGFIALGSVVLATVASVLIVGIMMLMAGFAEMIGAFQFKSWGKFGLWMLLGALYIIAGVLTFENPLFAAAALTLALGIALIVSGGMRLVLAFGMPRGSAWGMVMLSGFITLLLGCMILARWPLSSLFTLGIFLGIDMIFAGVGWLSMGLAMRSIPPALDARAPGSAA